MCEQTGILTVEPKDATEKENYVCRICAQSILPAPSSKISLTQNNEAYSNEAQISFGFEIVLESNRKILILTDVATSFSEKRISASGDADMTCTHFENGWILRHEAPAAVSADDEYSQKRLRHVLSAHAICNIRRADTTKQALRIAGYSERENSEI